MKPLWVLLLLLSLGACDEDYSTVTRCLDMELQPMTRAEHIHERDIYNEEDSCVEAGGRWFWECKINGELHAIPDDEFPLYNGAEANLDVCPR